MKKFKKAAFALSSASLIVAPVAVAVSCGSAGSNEDYSAVSLSSVATDVASEQAAESSAASTKIKVQVRSEDLGLYQKIAEKFNALGKGSVEIKTLTDGNIPGALELASAANSIPTVFVNDLNSNMKIKNEGLYAKPINISDFMGAENKDLYNVVDGEDNYTASDFNESQFKVLSNENKVSFSTPLGYGLRGLMFNSSMLQYIAGYDKTTKTFATPFEVHDAVPTDVSSSNKKGVEELTGTDHVTSIRSVDDIQGYINKAGENTSKAEGNWLGYGPGSMFQRIYSIGRAIQKASTNNALATVNIMPFKENLNNFGLFASFKKDILDSHGVLTKDKFTSEVFKDGKANPELAKYLWNSFAGYMYGDGSGFMTTSNINNTDALGEVEPFIHQQSLFNFNAKWAARMSNDGWKSSSTQGTANNKPIGFDSSKLANDGEAIKNGDMTVLSAPYGDVGVADALAISKRASAAESLVAKRFLKFIYQSKEDDKFKVTFDSNQKSVTTTMGEAISKNFVSSLKPINDKQRASAQNPTDFDKANNSAWYLMGKKDESHSSDEYNGVSGTVWKLTDSPYFQIFENNYFPNMMDFYGTKSTQSDKKWTLDQFTSEVNRCYEIFDNQMQLG